MKKDFWIMTLVAFVLAVLCVALVLRVHDFKELTGYDYKDLVKLKNHCEGELPRNKTCSLIYISK